MDASADDKVEQDSGDTQEEKKTPEVDLTSTTLEINDAGLKKVAERVEANSWPLVRPDDYEGDVAQQDVAKNFEKHYNLFQLREDYVEIQSYLDAEKSKFMESNPLTDEIPFKLREVKFMRDNYYKLTSRFYLKKTLEQRDFLHRMQDDIFLPVIPMASIKDTVKAIAGATVMMKVRQHHIPKFDDALWESFEKLWGLYDPKPDDQLATFEQFIHASYIEIIEKVVNGTAEQDPPTFEPLYEVSLGTEDKEEIRTRENLIRQAQPEDGDNVDVRLKKKWGAIMLKLYSTGMGIDEIPLTGLTKFRRQHYFDELGDVIKERLRMSIPKPLIAFDRNVKDVKDIEERKSLLTTLTTEDLKEVEAAVKAKYDNVLKSINPELRASLPRVPSPTFWENNYWSVMFEMFASKQLHENSLETAQSTMTGVGSPKKIQRLDVNSGDRNPAGVISSHNSGDAHAVGARQPSQSHNLGVEDEPGTFGMDALIAGTIYDGDSLPTSTKLEWIGAVALTENDCVGTHFKMEGWVIECEDSLRSVTMSSATTKKRTADNDEAEVKGTYVLDVLMADKQGPISVSMWDEEAKTFLRVVTAAKAASTAKPLILLENLRAIVAKNSKIKQLTPTKVVHSLRSIGVQAGTIITLSSTPSSPFTTSATFRAPTSQQHCITDFARARQQLQAPPFRATFRGIATNTSSIETTFQGKAKLTFDLVDQAGTFITMIAIGRNANTNQIKEGFDMMVFNASGRVAPGSATEGAVYLFRDAMVVPIARCTVPTKVRSIDI